MQMIIRVANMPMLALLMLTACVSGFMTDKFMGKADMMIGIPTWDHKLSPWIETDELICGRVVVWKVHHRSTLGASHKYTDDASGVDMQLNHLPNPSKYVFDVPVPNTVVNDAPKLVKNTYDWPEIYQHVSDGEEMDKIIGGMYAMYGEFPWQVNIQLRGSHQCGGSIINEFFIITSAHCIYGYREYDIRVIVGDYFLSREDPGEQTFQVEKLIPYEKYRFSSGASEYDIALIKIKPRSNTRGIIFGDYVQPVCLPIFDNNPPLSTHFIFSGWGYSNKDMFCAGILHGGNDICPGDSGGPLVYRKEDYFILYGLAESSSGCQLPNIPVVFTHVSMYLRWIRQKLKQHSKNHIQEAIPRRPRVYPLKL